MYRQHTRVYFSNQNQQSQPQCDNFKPEIPNRNHHQNVFEMNNFGGFRGRGRGVPTRGNSTRVYQGNQQREGAYIQNQNFENIRGFHRGCSGGGHYGQNYYRGNGLRSNTVSQRYVVNADNGLLPLPNYQPQIAQYSNQNRNFHYDGNNRGINQGYRGGRGGRWARGTIAGNDFHRNDFSNSRGNQRNVHQDHVLPNQQHFGTYNRYQQDRISTSQYYGQRQYFSRAPRHSFQANQIGRDETNIFAPESVAASTAVQQQNQLGPQMCSNQGNLNQGKDMQFSISQSGANNVITGGAFDEAARPNMASTPLSKAVASCHSHGGPNCFPLNQKWRKPVPMPNAVCGTYGTSGSKGASHPVASFIGKTGVQAEITNRNVKINSQNDGQSSSISRDPTNPIQRVVNQTPNVVIKPKVCKGPSVQSGNQVQSQLNVIPDNPNQSNNMANASSTSQSEANAITDGTNDAARPNLQVSTSGTAIPSVASGHSHGGQYHSSSNQKWRKPVPMPNAVCGTNGTSGASHPGASFTGKTERSKMEVQAKIANRIPVELNSQNAGQSSRTSRDPTNRIQRVVNQTPNIAIKPKVCENPSIQSGNQSKSQTPVNPNQSNNMANALSTSQSAQNNPYGNSQVNHQAAVSRPNLVTNGASQPFIAPAPGPCGQCCIPANQQYFQPVMAMQPNVAPVYYYAYPGPYPVNYYGIPVYYDSAFGNYFPVPIFPRNPNFGGSNAFTNFGGQAPQASDIPRTACARCGNPLVQLVDAETMT